MHLRIVLSTLVLAALAANPSLAKDSHAQHGARASTANMAKGAKGTSGANSPPSKANTPIDAGAALAPPVLPTHGAAQHQIRITNPSSMKNPLNAPHGQAGLTTTAAPVARNAIGQPVGALKSFAGAQSNVAPLAKPGLGSPPMVPAGSTHINVASATNRSLNSAPVGRPVVGPSAIGGPARAAYGINGTAVQSRH